MAGKKKPQIKSFIQRRNELLKTKGGTGAGGNAALAISRGASAGTGGAKKKK